MTSRDALKAKAKLNALAAEVGNKVDPWALYGPGWPYYRDYMDALRNARDRAEILAVALGNPNLKEE